MTDLKPCPFCGSENVATTKNDPDWDHVMCVACGGEGPEAQGEANAMTGWNRRASVAASSHLTEEAQPEHIEVECLTDESGTGYAVSFYVGRHKVYSKWTRLASAEKLARTLRNAFGEGPAMDPEAGRNAGVKEVPRG